MSERSLFFAINARDFSVVCIRYNKLSD